VLTRARAIGTDGLEITVDRGAEGITVRLRGHVGIDSSPELRDRLLGILRGQSAKAVIVDLTNVPYVDSSGIATLIEGLKIARNRDTMFWLQGLQGRLLHLFQITGLLALFETNGSGSTRSKPKVS
jgi:anti-sigma B factor antagonist